MRAEGKSKLANCPDSIYDFNLMLSAQMLQLLLLHILIP